MRQAHALAAETIEGFRSLLERLPNATCLAKLSFRDPDPSVEGDDALFFLWLTDVVYHPEEKLFSGMFYEVPSGLEKWHPVGSRLGFEAEDVFDWMVNDDGVAYGGFTIRLHRKRIPDGEWAAYDQYIGISSYSGEIR